MDPRLPRANESSGILPSRLGQYRVARRIGQGGMATVFEGRHPVLESRVALKLMHPALAADPRAAARFLREAKAAAQLRHQHVVEVFDMGTEAGVPFLVMEFLEGVDLAARIADAGALPLASIAAVFLPIASAIQAAHAAGIIHRDLKPANVMLARRPPREAQPVVLDFGISKLDDDAGLTRSGTVVGTLPYLAPELTNGARFASRASDQYSFSVMLYECATGRLPFEGDGPYALMHAIVNAELQPPSSLARGLPPEFDAIVLRGMQRDPARRFPSMEELGAALLAFAPRPTFDLWSDQFQGGRLPEGSGSEQALRTEPDAPREQPARYDGAPPPGARAKELASRSWLRVALLLGLYAMVLTLVLVLRWIPAREISPQSPVPGAPVASTGDVRATNEPTSPDSVRPSDASVGAAVSAPNVSAPNGSAPSSPTTAEAPSGRAPSTGARTREARPADARSARHSQRATPLGAGGADTEVSPLVAPVDLGTNGAPIVE